MDFTGLGVLHNYTVNCHVNVRVFKVLILRILALKICSLCDLQSLEIESKFQADKNTENVLKRAFGKTAIINKRRK